MELQPELFGVMAMPEKLTIVVTRLYERGNDVIEVVANAHPSKGSRGAWSHANILDGDLIRSVVDAEVGALLAHWTGPRWDRKPARLTSEDWRQHLSL